MAKKKTEKNPFEDLTFEQAIETLGRIVQKIETGQVPLEESLRQYEQGMALIGHCRNILLDAEKRIEVIGETHSSAAVSATGQHRNTPDDETDDDDESIEELDDENLF